MGIIYIFIMELYNVPTPSFVGIEMAAPTGWYNELKTANGTMTCTSVAKGLKAWRTKVVASKQWKTATKAKRSAYVKKVWQRLFEFDAAKKCGWVAARSQYCNEKRAKFDRYIRRHKSTAAFKKLSPQQQGQWVVTKVVPRVMKFLKKTKCHKFNVEWYKTHTFIKASLAKMRAQKK